MTERDLPSLTDLATKSSDGFEWAVTLTPRPQQQPLVTLRVRGGECGRYPAFQAAGVVSPSEVAASMAELAAALGVEGVVMTADLAAVAKAKRAEAEGLRREIGEREAEFEREIADLRRRVRRAELEARECERASLRLEALMARSVDGRGPRAVKGTSGPAGPQLKELILEHLAGHSTPVSLGELASALSRTPAAIGVSASYLVREGRLKRTDQGFALVGKRKAAAA